MLTPVSVASARKGYARACSERSPIDVSLCEPAAHILKTAAETLDLGIDFHTRRRQGALILTAAQAASPALPKPDRTLVRALVLANAWARDLTSGRVASIKALADRNGLCSHYTTRMLPLAYLAPDLQQQILEGRQPAALSLAALTDAPLSLDWGDQRRVVAAFG